MGAIICALIWFPQKIQGLKLKLFSPGKTVLERIVIAVGFAKYNPLDSTDLATHNQLAEQEQVALSVQLASFVLKPKDHESILDALKRLEYDRPVSSPSILLLHWHLRKQRQEVAG